MKPREVLVLLKDTIGEWSKDKVPTLAALAFYTILSTAPLLLIVIAIVGLVYSGGSAQQQVVDRVREAVGDTGANAVQSILASANRPRAGAVAIVLGGIMVLLGTSTVFRQLQTSLNMMWGISQASEGPAVRKVWRFVSRRLLSFAMVVGIGIVALAALTVSGVIGSLAHSASGSLPAGEVLFRIADFIVSFGIMALLFALMYKVIPDLRIKWSDVWVGALFTSFLFTLGKLGIGLYLNHSGTASSFGAFGGLVLILLWIYYSAHVVFFGAEFTKVVREPLWITNPAEKGSETRAD